MGGEYRFTVSIPDSIDGKVELSDAYGNYTAKGTLSSFGVDLTFPELGLRKTCKARDVHLLPAKIEDTFRVWETKYLRHVDQRNKEATAQGQAGQHPGTMARVLAQSVSP